MYYIQDRRNTGKQRRETMAAHSRQWANHISAALSEAGAGAGSALANQITKYPNIQVTTESLTSSTHWRTNCRCSPLPGFRRWMAGWGLWLHGWPPIPLLSHSPHLRLPPIASFLSPVLRKHTADSETPHATGLAGAQGSQGSQIPPGSRAALWAQRVHSVRTAYVMAQQCPHGICTESPQHVCLEAEIWGCWSLCMSPPPSQQSTQPARHASLIP